MESLTKYSLETLQKSVPLDVLEKLVLQYLYPQYSSDMKKVPTIIYNLTYKDTTSSIVDYDNQILYDIIELLFNHLPKNSKYMVEIADYSTDESIIKDLSLHNEKFGTDFKPSDGYNTTCNYYKKCGDYEVFVPLFRYDFRTDPEVIESLKNISDKKRKLIDIVDLYPFEKAFFITSGTDSIGYSEKMCIWKNID